MGFNVILVWKHVNTDQQTPAHVSYAGAGRRPHADAFMGRCMADMSANYTTLM